MPYMDPMGLYQTTMFADLDLIKVVGRSKHIYFPNGGLIVMNPMVQSVRKNNKPKNNNIVATNACDKNKSPKHVKVRYGTITFSMFCALILVGGWGGEKSV